MAAPTVCTPSTPDACAYQNYVHLSTITAQGVTAQSSLNYMNSRLLAVELRLDTLVPVSTTTLANIDDGSVINSMIKTDGSVWLIGVFCAFVFILGWRAAE